MTERVKIVVFLVSCLIDTEEMEMLPQTKQKVANASEIVQKYLGKQRSITSPEKLAC